MDKLEQLRYNVTRICQIFVSHMSPTTSSSTSCSRQPSVRLINRKLNNLLHLAVRKNNRGMVRVALRLGGDVGALDYTGYSVFERACMHGDPEVVRSLLGHVDAEDSRVYPALMVAAALAPAHIQTLLAPLVKPHPNATDHQGRTAVTLACARDMEHVVRKLTTKARYLRCSADPWCDPFLTSCRVASASLIIYLLNKVKAVVDRHDHRGRTPLHFLCSRGKTTTWVRKSRENITEMYVGIDDVIRTLIGKGADVNAVDSRQRTPLHYLCDSASRHVRGPVGRLAAIASVLLQHGADITGTDYMGHTPFQLCTNFGFINSICVGSPRLDIHLADRLSPFTLNSKETNSSLLLNATLPFMTWPNAADPLLAHVLTLPKAIKCPTDALSIISATYPRAVYNCIQHMRGDVPHDVTYTCEVSARELQCLVHLWLVYHPVHVDSRFYPFNMADVELPFPSLQTLATAEIRQRLPQKPLIVIETDLLRYLPTNVVSSITMRRENQDLYEKLHANLFE